MKPTLQLKLSQHLTLTPQLQQSIRLLQLSTLELNAEVERLLQENPLLEKADEDETPLPPPEFSMEASTAPASTESSSSDDRDDRASTDFELSAGAGSDNDWGSASGDEGRREFFSAAGRDQLASRSSERAARAM